MTEKPPMGGDLAPRRQRGAALTSLARRPLRTVRPDQAAGQYAQPRQQLAKMARNGELHRAANGYYVVVPRASRGTNWLPPLEAAAAGIAAADFGVDHAVLMGVSAARLHGAVPRGLAVAVVAVPVQRARVRLRDRVGSIIFVKRNVDRLDAERFLTELGAALVTTVEQTVLDLAHRPQLGGAGEDVPAAIRSLLPRCDRRRLDELANAQRLRAARDRAVALG